MRKSGKIINIEKNKVYIITEKNEFVTLEKHTGDPVIGQLYEGYEFQKVVIWKFMLTIAFIILLIFSLRKLYLDNKYNYSVIVDMNCSIKMEVSGSDTIKKVEGLSEGGYKIIKLVSLKHKSLDEALKLILDQSIKQEYLTKAHAEDGFKISIFVTDNKNNVKVNIPEFNRYAKTHDFKVLLNNKQPFID
ncbi:MAG: anti-sigma-I factor RsgI family protein [Clostridium sp.]|uniref:anti-sigma-I factor RsgI family protein n=1 Tax=Clostridium sp. TaxID=1506 RepID=UPI003D6D1719